MNASFVRFLPLKVLIPRWKLHLRPKGLASSQVTDNDLPPLPQNKSAAEVLSDFMKYLFNCARTYIQDSYSVELWNSVEDNIDFVLTHPNGWQGPQQGQIRRAAVSAGLISDTADGHARLQLLTEGEASLHFCIGSGFGSGEVEARVNDHTLILVILFALTRFPIANRAPKVS